MEMTQAIWNGLPEKEKAVIRDNSGLSPQLIGLEGRRVEVETLEGEKRRFYVGRSTGWKPVHIEVKTSRSQGGFPADKQYKSVKEVPSNGFKVVF